MLRSKICHESTYLDLDIEHGIRVDFEAKSDFHVMCQSLLVCLFNLSPLFRECLVINMSQQAFELVQILEPDTFGYLESRADKRA